MVARVGSLSAASRKLRVDPATVGRRVARLESALGLRCFERRADGYRLTEPGLKLLEHAQRVEEDLLTLTRAVDAEDRMLSGVVALTASESVSLPFLIPSLPGLQQRYPGIRVDLISSNRVLSLARREADIAVRMIRPEEGDLLARRIATMRYGLYASPGYLERAGIPSRVEDLSRHALIDWLEDYPKAGVTAWFRQITAERPAVARLDGAQERLAAAVSGVGITPLAFIMARETGLRRVLPEIEPPPIELWLLAHPDTAKVRRVRAVMEYVAERAVAEAARFGPPG